MDSFWSLVLRIEALWNSPLRVEVLRILATTIFFGWELWLVGSGACGGVIGSSGSPSVVNQKMS